MKLFISCTGNQVISQIRSIYSKPSFMEKHARIKRNNNKKRLSRQARIGGRQARVGLQRRKTLNIERNDRSVQLFWGLIFRV